jgi:hypothetical protein
MRDDPTVVALVLRAKDGDKSAWNELVERYAAGLVDLPAVRASGAGC